MASMITSTAWVPRGYAAPFPTKYKFDEEEFERITELAKLKLDDAKEALSEAQEEEHEIKSSKEEKKEKKQDDDDGDDIAQDDDLKEYDLEHYDDDNEDLDKTASQGLGMAMFGNIKSLAYHESNKDDPYITLKDDGANDDDDEREDLQILATDNMFLAAKVEDDLAHLEVYVYEDEADNLYVHHDIMLPAIPLCVEWLDIAVGKLRDGRDKDAAANYVAIGTFDPDIEIWDLDTVDCMYPNAVLGQGGSGGSGDAGEERQDNDKKKNKKKKKKKRAKSGKPNDAYHVDAVLALAANRKHRNLLASGSADKTVKLWDLHTARCAASYNSLHTDKVCSLAWHAAETAVLLSGSYDRTACVADMRAPGSAPSARAGVESDVEAVRWDPHSQDCFFVATERGAVHCFDARVCGTDPAASRALWTLQAHDEAVSSLDVSPVISGLMATGSTDKTVKLWSYGSAAGTETTTGTKMGPSLVVSREFKEVGKVFSATFAPDPEVAFRLAVAGSKGAVEVWDTSTNAYVRKVFAGRIPRGGRGAAATGGKEEDANQVQDRLVVVHDDQESSSSGEEDEDEDEEGQSGRPRNGDAMDED